MSNPQKNLEVEVTVIPRGRGRRRDVALSGADEPKLAAIPRTARLMALALKFENMIQRGEVRDFAEIARLGWVTRARLTQIMNLLLLAPDIQERLLLSDAATLPSERNLRQVATQPMWRDQRELFAPQLDVIKSSYC